MRYFISIIFLSGFLIFNWFNSAQAANPLDIIINEVAWMGTEVSYNDEWVELRNNIGQEINLEGWILKAADGTPEIKLARTVLANGFYLLERTDDNTISNVVADQIYTGALGNSGEKLELYDNFGNLIDSVDASSGWPAGDNTTKQTMERTGTGWQTSANAGGTPKAENNKAADVESPLANDSSTPEVNASTSGVSSVPNVKIDGVILNEILPSPAGPDEEEEWIEIFNKNNFEVNVSDWQITDKEGGVKVYTFPEGTAIGANGFLVLSRPTTKITLNNQGDGLKFIQPDGNLLNEVNYKNAPRGESYALFDSDWAWTPDQTPGSANTPKAPANSVKLDLTKNLTENAPQEQLMAAGVLLDLAQNRQTPKSFYAFIITVVLAIFSGITVLFLKRKLTS